MLLTLYNTGARASEITALRQSQVIFGKSNFLVLHGKGRKERTVPLWLHTAQALRAWFNELDEQDANLAFPNAAGGCLTRNGLNYILQHAVREGAKNCPSLKREKVTPHMVRHSTAAPFVTIGSRYIGDSPLARTRKY